MNFRSMTRRSKALSASAEERRLRDVDKRSTLASGTGGTLCVCLFCWLTLRVTLGHVAVHHMAIKVGRGKQIIRLLILHQRHGLEWEGRGAGENEAHEPTNHGLNMSMLQRQADLVQGTKAHKGLEGAVGHGGAQLSAVHAVPEAGVGIRE